MPNTDPTPMLRRALARIARVPRLLVGLDFDGTLAPFQVDLTRSRAMPTAMASVRELVSLPGTTVAFVSGRSLESLTEVSGSPEGVVLVGSHGLERRMGDGTDSPAALTTTQRKALGTLDARVEAISAEGPGSLVERKPTSVSLHTRGVKDPVLARDLEARARSAAADLPGVHVMDGKRIVELAVLLGDKGRALAQLFDRVGADAAFYAGDDATDERAFAALGPTDVGVHVGDGPTAAGFSVAGIDRVPIVLAELARERATWARPA